MHENIALVCVANVRCYYYNDISKECNIISEWSAHKLDVLGLVRVCTSVVHMCTVCMLWIILLWFAQTVSIVHRCLGQHYMSGRHWASE